MKQSLSARQSLLGDKRLDSPDCCWYRVFCLFANRHSTRSMRFSEQHFPLSTHALTTKRFLNVCFNPIHRQHISITQLNGIYFDPKNMIKTVLYIYLLKIKTLFLNKGWFYTFFKLNSCAYMLTQSTCLVWIWSK